MPEIRDGNTQTTQIGFITRNGQRNHGTFGVVGTDHGQVTYRLECTRCGYVYGANGTDIHELRCPECQHGAPRIRYWTSMS